MAKRKEIEEAYLMLRGVVFIMYGIVCCSLPRITEIKQANLKAPAIFSQFSLDYITSPMP